MKLAHTLLIVASLLVVPLAAHAGDKKPAKEEAAAKSAGKEVTLDGTFGCAKCSFKEAKACQNVLKVKKGGKDVTYELADNQVSKDHHEAICHDPGKPATVKGTVAKDGGKMVLTASEITFK